MLNAYYAPIVTAQGDGNAVANSASQTSLLTGNAAQAKYTFPQNFFQMIGQKLKIHAWGRVSTLATTPGTLSFDFKFGAAAVFAGGAMTINVNAQTNTPWILDVDLILRVVGASAAFFPVGRWMSHAVIGSSAIGTAGAGTQMLPYNTAPAVGATFDGGATQLADLFVTWQTASASNSIQLHGYELVSCF